MNDRTARFDRAGRLTAGGSFLIQQSGELGVSQAVILEVLQGARSTSGQRLAKGVLDKFPEVETIPADFRWARDKLSRYGPSHNIGAFDCLIAASAARLNLPLYTTNLKHFAPLLGTLAVKPY